MSNPHAATIGNYKPGTWKVERCEITFSVRQLLVFALNGRFNRSQLTIRTGSDPLGSSALATIELASLVTGNDKRDEHIHSATFLDTATHPTASYRSTGVREAGTEWIIDGDLTLHGNTRPMSLTVGTVWFGHGPDGEPRASFTAMARVKRSEFGIDRWSGGGFLASDKVSISVEIHAVEA